MYLNKVMIIGNLTRDPEHKALPSGMKVTSLSMATNRTWKDKEGKKQEDVEYHNVVAFGKQAEIIAEYMKKGSQMFVEGRIQTRSWDDKEGVKKYRTEIIVDTFQFGSKAGTTKADLGGVKDTEPKEDTIEYPSEEINAEDIPF